MLASLATLLACAKEPMDLNAALALPEAQRFLQVEGSLQQSVAEGPGDVFTSNARALGAAATAWRARLSAPKNADVERLAAELAAVAALTGPGLQVERIEGHEVRDGIAAAIRQHLYTLREVRPVLGAKRRRIDNDIPEVVP